MTQLRQIEAVVVGGRALIICLFLTERRWQHQHAFHVPWLQFYGVVREIVLIARGFCLVDVSFRCCGVCRPDFLINAAMCSGCGRLQLESLFRLNAAAVAAVAAAVCCRCTATWKCSCSTGSRAMETSG
jgi:hypothetical protein